MASTSLRRQVDALRTASAGTSSGYIQRKKGKPSLLLTPDQAANVDLASVRETALLGLQRLEAVDASFSAFQVTLFSKEAETTLRDLQTEATNARIDKSITSFLALVSPHFSSREAHLCLEYLVRHYKIYQYNVDAVVECILPWHDTVAFARMVQLLSIKGTKWNFLEPVQKTGSPLPREAIARRCARDYGLLRFLCVSARRSATAAAAAGSTSLPNVDGSSGHVSPTSPATASGRAKLFSFYAAVVIEALGSLGSTNESLLRALVPDVVHGLSATRSPEYQMASYMILSALAGKGPLAPDVTNAALTTLICKPCQGGLEPSLLCAIAVMQSQVGFTTKNDNSSTSSAVSLPTAAFKTLSSSESFPGVLAGLSEKFDASPFLSVLLQTYVEHLCDEDGEEHASSLIRLCTFPHWPVFFMPRAIKKMIDRLVKSHLAIVYEAEIGADDASDSSEKKRRAEASTTETQRVLRVLGQRYPDEVDWAVSKVSRYVKSKASSTSALLTECHDIIAVGANREASLKEKALSSLLGSTFAGAELAHHMPLQRGESTAGEGAASAHVHASLMVALENPSGNVRVHALNQLARSLAETPSSQGNTPTVGKQRTADDNLATVILRRLYDQDPNVVTAITDNEVFLMHMLARTSNIDNAGAKIRLMSLVSRTDELVEAATSAAKRWLAAISQPRPKYTTAESSRALIGLIRLACGAIRVGSHTLFPPVSDGDLDEDRSRHVGQDAPSVVLRFILECLPGPHMNARVKRAAAATVQSLTVAGNSAQLSAAASKDKQKARKKALRGVARASIDALSTFTSDAGDGMVRDIAVAVRKKFGGRSSDNVPSEKKRAEKRENRHEQEKSKTLTAMGKDVCDSLSDAFASGRGEDLQELAVKCGPGGRWLLMDCVARAIPTAQGVSPESREKDSIITRLSCILASLVTSELQRWSSARSSSSSDSDVVSPEGAALPADVLHFLPSCAAFLPCGGRPLSLFGADHLRGHSLHSPLTVEALVATPDDAVLETTPTLGDVLVAVLGVGGAVDGDLRSSGKKTIMGDVSSSSAAVVEAVSSVVLRKRPLFVLAALAISGISSPLACHGVRHDRITASAASSALRIAATLLRAASETDDEARGTDLVTADDVVAVFPTAILALASDSEAVREAGIFFMSTIAEYGAGLTSSHAAKTSPRAESKSKRGTASLSSQRAMDSEIFPLLASDGSASDENDTAVTPIRLSPPELTSVVALAALYTGKNNKWGASDLGKHLSDALSERSSETNSSARTNSSELDESTKRELTHYLVAWAARLGWRNPSAAATLFECLRWAGAMLRQVSMPLLRHTLDGTEDEIIASIRLLKFLFVTVLSAPWDDVPTPSSATSGSVAPSNTMIGTTSPKRKRRRSGSIDATTMSTTANKLSSATLANEIAATPLAEETATALHKALRMQGRVQTLALEALASRAGCGGVGAAGAQRQSFLYMLVEAGLEGADSFAVATAAAALPTLPIDLAAVVVDLVGSVDSTNETQHDAGQTRKKRKQSTTPTQTRVPSTAKSWVSTFNGVVELTQALLTPPATSTPRWNGRAKATGHRNTHSGFSARAADSTTSSQGSRSSKPSKAWGGSDSCSLARPLFDAIPVLFRLSRGDVSGVAPTENNQETEREQTGFGSAVTGEAPDVAAAEYAMWLTMDVLASILRRGFTGNAGEAGVDYAEDRAAKDAESVLACVREDPSPQTRNSALALLSALATQFPAAMASRLRSLLDAVGVAAASGRGGQTTLRKTQAAIQSVVPALRLHGAEVGIGAHFVIQVFVEVLGKAPMHTRRALFGTLVDSLGEKSLAIMASLLLHRAASASSAEDDEDSSVAVDFVHQTCHFSGAQAQVVTLVRLVQACHRLSVKAAERSEDLLGSCLKETLDSFGGTSGADATGDQAGTGYMTLQLNDDLGDVVVSPTADFAFMSLDLDALLVSSSAKKNDASSVDSLSRYLETMLGFVRDHLVSKQLLMTMAAAAKAEGQGAEASAGVQHGFLLLCEELLSFSRTLATCEEGISSTRGKERLSWRSLQDVTYSVFDTLQSLLSVPSFVAVVQTLLHHEDPHLRRKALQMFTRRLDPAGGGRPRFNPGEESLFIDMLPSLRKVAMGQTGSSSVTEDATVDGGKEEALARVENTGGADESAVNRQTAMLSVDALVRVLGRRHQSAFVGVLEDMTDIVAGTGPGALPVSGEGSSDGNLPLRSTTFLLLATLCAVLGVRAFPCFPRFFPPMLAALERLSQSMANPTPDKSDRGSSSGQGLLWTSALSAVATVAASLPSFLSPHLPRIIAIALRPAAAPHAAAGTGSGAIAKKQAADRVLSLLAAGVEPRLLFPAVCGAYDGCVKIGDAGESCSSVARSVARLLTYVQEVVAGMQREAAAAALPQFTRLLTQALDFRRLRAFSADDEARGSAEMVEEEASSAIVSFVMKLSEVELRPLFLHLCEWKAAGFGEDAEGQLRALDRRLSFYSVLEGLASSLKSIFTPYFAHVLTDCCQDLEGASALAQFAGSSHQEDDLKESSDSLAARSRGKGSTTSRKRAREGPSVDRGRDVEAVKEAGSEMRWHRSRAARVVLSALRWCFQFDRSGFVDKARFDVVMPAVVSQLECGADYVLGGRLAGDEVALCRLHCEELVGPCLAQLASASAKDVLWKALANAVLLRTRSEKAGVRVAALIALRQCFEVVGEDFLALLPECLPFLSELLEDGHPEVEGECRQLVKYIEGILGESIESHLS